jgi:hypothetical protein
MSHDPLDDLIEDLEQALPTQSACDALMDPTPQGYLRLLRAMEASDARADRARRRRAQPEDPRSATVPVRTE